MEPAALASTHGEPPKEDATFHKALVFSLDFPSFKMHPDLGIGAASSANNTVDSASLTSDAATLCGENGQTRGSGSHCSSNRASVYVARSFAAPLRRNTATRSNNRGEVSRVQSETRLLRSVTGPVDANKSQNSATSARQQAARSIPKTGVQNTFGSREGIVERRPRATKEVKNFASKTISQSNLATRSTVATSSGTTFTKSSAATPWSCTSEIYPESQKKSAASHVQETPNVKLQTAKNTGNQGQKILGAIAELVERQERLNSELLQVKKLQEQCLMSQARLAEIVQAEQSAYRSNFTELQHWLSGYMREIMNVFEDQLLRKLSQLHGGSSFVSHNLCHQFTDCSNEYGASTTPTRSAPRYTPVRHSGPAGNGALQTVITAPSIGRNNVDSATVNTAASFALTESARFSTAGGGLLAESLCLSESGMDNSQRRNYSGNPATYPLK